MTDVSNLVAEYLSHNSRMSIQEIAKKIRKPRHLVAYYKRKLLHDKIIIHSELLINYEALGYQEYIIYLKIFQYQNIKKNILDSIINHPNVKWCSELFPRFNLRIVILARNIKEFQDILDNIEKVCGKNLVKKEILITREILKEETFTTIKRKEVKPSELLSLSQEDKNLIKELFKEPDESLLNLSQKTELSIEGVRKKIKKFQETGLIKGFSAKFDLTKINKHFWCVLSINVNNLATKIKKIQEIIYSEVSYGKTRTTIGPWNLEITIYAQSYHHLIKIIKYLENILEQDIENYELYTYTEKILNTRIPKTIIS